MLINQSPQYIDGPDAMHDIRISTDGQRLDDSDHTPKDTIALLRLDRLQTASNQLADRNFFDNTKAIANPDMIGVFGAFVNPENRPFRQAHAGRLRPLAIRHDDRLHPLFRHFQKSQIKDRPYLETFKIGNIMKRHWPLRRFFHKNSSNQDTQIDKKSQGAEQSL
jgi:hypothetical protein